MVHIVNPVGFNVGARGHDAVLLFDHGDIASAVGVGQADECGVKLRGIAADKFGRVAVGIDADEDGGHVFGLLAQLLEGIVKGEQFGGAHVRAVGEAEGQQDDFAFQAA